MLFDLEVHTGEALNDWVVYIHQLSGETVYVGYCKLLEIFQFPDARRNIEWLKNASNTKIKLTIFSRHSNRIEAHNSAHKLVLQLRPIWNMKSSRVGRSEPVMCNETGQQFQSANAAALFYGVQKSTISNHLAGRKGYEKISGHFTFQRVL